MSQFIESICFKEGHYQLADLHQTRINSTFQSHFPESKPWQLRDILPSLSGVEKQKVRLRYTHDDFEIDAAPYSQKPVQSVFLVPADEIEYSFKWADRKGIENLMTRKGPADDIIIIKKGYITDSSYANVIFSDGKNWFTPDTFLLNGVKRQFLLQTGEIQEMKMTVSAVLNFEKVGLINAMLDPGDLSLDIENIVVG